MQMQDSESHRLAPVSTICRSRFEYDTGKVARKLGFTCKTGFREVLDSLG